MQHQLRILTLNYTTGSYVDVDIRLEDLFGKQVYGKKQGLILSAMDAESSLPLPFEIDGISQSDFWLDIGDVGYVRVTAAFDLATVNVGKVIFCGRFPDEERCFYSKELRLMTYGMRIVKTTLTEDIRNYTGEGGIHYTNNVRARVRITYQVTKGNGVVTDTDELETFHQNISYQLLFANGDKMEYLDENRNIVEIKKVDCMVKRKKNKKLMISRVAKDVIEMNAHRIHDDGTIEVPFRVNIFSTHDALKERNLAGRRHTIELGHPMADSVTIPGSGILLLTKYHKPKENSDITSEKKDKIGGIFDGGKCGGAEYGYVKPEQVYIKTEKIKTENDQGYDAPYEVHDEVRAVAATKSGTTVFGAPCHEMSALFPQPSSHINSTFIPSFPSPSHDLPLHCKLTPKDVSRIFVDKYLASTMPKNRRKNSAKRAFKTPHRTKPTSFSYLSGPLVKKIKLERGVSSYPLLSPERVFIKPEVEELSAVISPYVSPKVKYVSEDDDQFQYHSRELDSNESLSDMDEETMADFFSGWL